MRVHEVCVCVDGGGDVCVSQCVCVGGGVIYIYIYTCDVCVRAYARNINFVLHPKIQKSIID